MGVFRVDAEIRSPHPGKAFVRVPKALVESGSGFTWFPAEILRGAGVVVAKKGLEFRMADGRSITRSVGYAIVRAGGFETVDEVVFGRRGDLTLLGTRTLEGFGAHVDPRRKRLVASGPHVTVP
jgi:predicted aspartyl protease